MSAERMPRVSDWLRRYAEELGQDPLSGTEVALLLDLARDVAHGTERRFAPVSAFIAGLYAAGRDDRAAGLEEAARVAHVLLEPRGDSS